MRFHKTTVFLAAFVCIVCDTQMARLATRMMLGESLESLGAPQTSTTQTESSAKL